MPSGLNTLFDVKNFIKLEEVNSTNLYAKTNLAKIPDKSVVCAEKQTAGRGRFERTWVDLGEGNIFISLVLKPSDKFNPVYSNLTQYFSLVLCKLLEEYGIEPQIKWPNDVLIEGRKIAGILSETVVQGSNFKGLILGAGINLNARKEDLSKIKDKEVTALNLELNKPVDKELFLAQLIDKFFSKYDEFLYQGFAMIEKDYIEHTNFLGKEISVKGYNDVKTGIAKAINKNGELILDINGKNIELTIGDIL